MVWVAENALVFILIIALLAVAVYAKLTAFTTWYPYVKPLPVFIVLLQAIVMRSVPASDMDLFQYQGDDPSHHLLNSNFLLVIFGIFFGMLGDIGLTLPFAVLKIGGVVAFMIGHVLYIAAFTVSISWNLAVWATLFCCLVYGVLGLLFAFLVINVDAPVLKDRKIAVVVLGEIYLAFISVMVLSSFNFESATFSASLPAIAKAPFVAIGAAFFFISDCLLIASGLIEHQTRKSVASALVLVFYYLGQTGIGYGMSYKYFAT